VALYQVPGLQLQLQTEVEAFRAASSSARLTDENKEEEDVVQLAKSDLTMSVQCIKHGNNGGDEER